MEKTDTQPRRRRKRLMVTTSAVGILALTAAFLGYSSRASAVSTAQAATPDSENEDKKKDPATVAVHEVAEGPISAYITATANLVAQDEVKVVAEAEGEAIELLVEEGDDVRKGQKLLQIDKGDAVLAVRKAELALQNESLELDRAERMAADKLISSQDLDKARYERELAEHELTEARYRLSKTAVRAPFTGTITLRAVQAGQTVKVGEELFTLADFNPLVARIFLPEQEVLDLSVGQEAQLCLKARPDMKFRGRVQRISPVVDTASGTVKITVEAIAPPPNVHPSAFVSVGVVRETRPRALLIPRPAVIHELQDTYVYVADGNVARKRSVELGLQEGNNLEVTEGLTGGELVVTAGQGALEDEAPIEVVDAAGLES